jgi:hypothetical protein
LESISHVVNRAYLGLAQRCVHQNPQGVISIKAEAHLYHNDMD